MTYVNLDGHDLTRLGTVEFTVECTAPAQEKFNRAMALYHSFAWQAAAASFADIAEAFGVAVLVAFILAVAKGLPLREAMDGFLATNYQNDTAWRHSMVVSNQVKEIDREQLVRFDDMFEDSALEGKIDLWASGVAANRVAISVRVSRVMVLPSRRTPSTHAARSPESESISQLSACRQTRTERYIERPCLTALRIVCSRSSARAQMLGGAQATSTLRLRTFSSSSA